MKHKSKIYRWLPSAVIGAGMTALMLASAGTTFAQTADFTINTFDSAINGVGNWYGSGTYTFDATQDATGNGGGSLYIVSQDDTNSDTPLNPFICIAGGNPWYNAGTVDLTQYKSIDFDIKWDNTSALTIDQYNNTGTWPTNYGPAGNFNGDPYQKGFNIKAVSPNGPSFIQLGSTNIPTAASNGWVHMSFPINPATAGISFVNGIDFEKYISGNYKQILGPPWPTAKFWIDNVVLKGTAGPPPPPTISPLSKTTKGLNVIFNSSGQYDRHSARLIGNTGKSWVGHATVANPVSYSFTMNGFPKDGVTAGSGAYLFLIPNPIAHDNAPDYNETNCVIASLQQGITNSTLTFQYKVNEAYGNNMQYGQNGYTNIPGSWNGVTPNYLESGVLGTVSTLGSTIGKWSIIFTSDTNITMIAPDNSTTNFVMPTYNVGNFAEVSSFDVYLGGQPNQAITFNEAVVYSNFAISNTVTPFYDNFLADTTLNTTNWDTSVSASPSGVLVVPATAPYWATWTLPAGGYGLETGSTLSSFASWTSPSMYPVVGLNGADSQLIDSSELPAGNTAFFNLIKRTFTKLQVLLPGETNAPGTVSGKIGTPIPQSVSTPTSVTVNAVDATWHIVSGSFDQIQLSTTDGSAFLPTPASLSNGSVTFTTLLFQTQGSWTVTATDTTDGTKTPNTSSSVTVGP
jgi:hypothetical protein